MQSVKEARVIIFLLGRADLGAKDFRRTKEQFWREIPGCSIHFLQYADIESFSMHFIEAFRRLEREVKNFHRHHQTIIFPIFSQEVFEASTNWLPAAWVLLREAGAMVYPVVWDLKPIAEEWRPDRTLEYRFFEEKVPFLAMPSWPRRRTVKMLTHFIRRAVWGKYYPEPPPPATGPFLHGSLAIRKIVENINRHQSLAGV